MGLRSHDAFLHAPDPLLDRQRAVRVSAQRQRIDEHADNPLHILMMPAGSRYSHHNVLLAAVLRQQQVVGRQQDHIQRGSLRGAKPFEPPGHTRIELECKRSAIIGAYGWTNIIRHQFRFRQLACELLLPVFPVRFVSLMVPVALLKDGIILVLYLRGRQGFPPVEPGQIPIDDPHGDAVAHNMVNVNEQYAEAIAELGKHGPDERTAAQIEGSDERAQQAGDPALPLFRFHRLGPIRAPIFRTRLTAIQTPGELVAPDHPLAQHAAGPRE